MSESIELHVVRFPIPANGDLLAHIDLLEEYEQVITGWDRADIAVPSFEQWSYTRIDQGNCGIDKKSNPWGNPVCSD